VRKGQFSGWIMENEGAWNVPADSWQGKVSIHQVGADMACALEYFWSVGVLERFWSALGVGAFLEREWWSIFGVLGHWGIGGALGSQNKFGSLVERWGVGGANGTPS
jgi:hypothetical protein